MCGESATPEGVAQGESEVKWTQYEPNEERTVDFPEQSKAKP